MRVSACAVCIIRGTEISYVQLFTFIYINRRSFRGRQKMMRMNEMDQKWKMEKRKIKRTHTHLDQSSNVAIAYAITEK